MKVIALRDHINNYEAEIDKAANPRNIHKGAVFEFGPATAKEPKDLSVAARQQLALLVYSNCLGDAMNEKTVARVKEEVEIDRKREAAADKLNRQAAAAHLAIATAAFGGAEEK